jgi:hypothetical protein
LRITPGGITDSGLAELARMETLEQLSLSGGAITDEGVRQLFRLPRLKHLYLGENPGISDECVASLREAHPGIVVIFEPYGPAPRRRFPVGKAVAAVAFCASPVYC